MNWIRNLVLPVVLGAALTATDVEAQGRGKSDKQKDKDKVERQDRDRRDWELRRRDSAERDRDQRYEDGRRRGVPPGWCIGRGNPHNTVENCGRRGERYDPRYDTRRDDRDDRYEDRDDRYDDRRYGSYEQAHDAYHRNEYARCRARLAERPLDVTWQLRVRAECNRQHDEWHRRAGRSHS